MIDKKTCDFCDKKDCEKCVEEASKAFCCGTCCEESKKEQKPEPEEPVNVCKFC